ncbi:MAG TPA: MMPL family transporter [Gemmatimonadales bacterium]|nr:MMPL family transporter [Gemmatimonadales bacterium]
MIRLPARTIVRWRWPIVCAWVALTALMVPLGEKVHERLHVGGENLSHSESTAAEDLIRSDFDSPYAAFAAVAIRHPSLTLRSRRYTAYVDSITAALRRLPFVLQTLNWRNAEDEAFRSRDGRITFVLIGLSADSSATSDTPLLRQTVATVQQRFGSDFRTYVTGDPAFDYDIRTIAADDSRLMEQRLVPLTMLLLLVAFGTLVAAMAPIAVGFIAITISLGLVSIAATIVPMSIFVLNLTTMIGLGVGIDYSLLVVTRFREEMDYTPNRLEAAAETIRTASRTVITSGGTVMIGFIALMIVPLQETRSIGLAGLFVVATSVALSVTFLPAMLAILGRHIDRPLWLARRLRRLRFGRWNRYARAIARHPWRAVTISGAIVVALALPALWLQIGLPVVNWFPTDTDSGRGLAVLEDMGHGGALRPLKVVVQMTDGSPVLDPDRLRGLRELADSIRANPTVAQVRGMVDLRPGIPLWQYVVLYADTARARQRMPDVFRTFLGREGTATMLDVVLRDTVSLNGSLEAVREVRRIDVRKFPTLQHARMMIGGFSASNLDFRDKVLGLFPLLVALVLGVTGVMLAAVFRSVLVPIKAVVMNTLSVSAAFGLTVVVFQWGLGGSLFGLAGPTQAIFVISPVLVFAIVFGLSMDYEVFLLSRVKEEFDEKHDNDEATVNGLTATAGTITNAALIMILVFGVFAFARVMAVQMISFGLAVAVLLDATLIRVAMVPGVMHLAGRLNWWPGYRRGRGGEVARTGGAGGGPEAGAR